MTSPGLKRPLEYDTLTQSGDLSSSGTPLGGATGDDADPNSISKLDSQNKSADVPIDDSNIGSTNGTKRRCTTNNNTPKTNIKYPMNATGQLAAYTAQGRSNSFINSPFKDPSPSLSVLKSSISDLIEEELQDDQQKELAADDDIMKDDAYDSRPMTVRQAQNVCERLVHEMDIRLREDYDRILARKLAEQYDIFAKANYLNSFVESAQQIPATAGTQILNSSQASASSATSNPTLDAFAAALQIQRSVAAAAATNSQPSTPAPNPVTDLNQIAASLRAANSHTSAITPTPHHLSFNPFQQQAAAAAVAAIQQQAAARHGQQQQHIAGQHRATPVTIGQTNTGLAVPTSPFPAGPVLLSSNLDAQLAVPEALFTLFGVFGDVIRVKILFNKKDNALIQMADSTQAQVAQGYLDKQRIYGKIIRVTRSKHQFVQMPRDGNQSDAGLTKDFTNSPLHRFKIPGSRNYQNIYPPSNTLHISNIPATVEESDLHKAFKEQCGFEFASFKFFPKDKKMALMRFASTENATIALIKMHNFQISEENNLRVSFSKTLI